jgi:nitroreductase
METYEAIVKRRSIRRFKMAKVSMDVLKKCVNAARLAPSAANLQPLHYIIITNNNLVTQIFSFIKWAGYLKWNPRIDEGPPAYILVISDKRITGGEKYKKYDVAFATENIVLAALSEGIGTCILAAFDQKKIRMLLNIPLEYDIELLIALGYADEQSFVEEMTTSIQYYRKGKKLYVPKRRLEEIIHNDTF